MKSAIEVPDPDIFTDSIVATRRNTMMVSHLAGLSEFDHIRISEITTGREYFIFRLHGDFIGLWDRMTRANYPHMKYEERVRGIVRDLFQDTLEQQIGDEPADTGIAADFQAFLADIDPE